MPTMDPLKYAMEFTFVLPGAEFKLMNLFEFAPHLSFTKDNLRPESMETSKYCPLLCVHARARTRP